MTVDPRADAVEGNRLREQIADELARNDECGPGPVSRDEYLADADALLRIVRSGGDSTPRDPHGSMLCCGGTDYHDAGCPVPELEARVVELEGALESAIYLAEDKWPVEARTLRARFLAAAGEGQDRLTRAARTHEKGTRT